MSYADRIRNINVFDLDVINIAEEADKEIESRQHADDKNTDLILKLTDDLEAKDRLIDELMLGFSEIRDNLDGDVESICDFALDLTERTNK